MARLKNKIVSCEDPVDRSTEAQERMISGGWERVCSTAMSQPGLKDGIWIRNRKGEGFPGLSCRWYKNNCTGDISTLVLMGVRTRIGSQRT